MQTSLMLYASLVMCMADKTTVHSLHCRTVASCQDVLQAQARDGRQCALQASLRSQQHPCC